MPHSDIVITGLGVVSALGIGRDEFWNGIRNSQSSIRSLADRDDGSAKPASTQENDPFWLGAPILDFEPKQYVRPRKALKVMCREIQTAFAASDLAIRDAGLGDHLPADADGIVSPSRLGTVFGSEMFYGPPSEMVTAFNGCLRDDGTVDESRFGNAAMKGVMPLWMLKYLPNMPACQVGIAVNAHGPNNSIVLGDVSGPAALIESASCLQRGHADLMISGATGTRINTTRLNYRLDYPIATAHDTSQLNSPGASGVIGGEGSAVITMETASHAAVRSAPPLARWLGHASRFHASDTMRRHDRSGDLTNGQRGSTTAVANAIRAALADAKVSPSELGFIVSHGMGDPAMDTAERQAIDSVCGDVPVIAPMTWLGHAGAASGLFSVATAICILAESRSPDFSFDEIPWRDGKRVSTQSMGDSLTGLCVSHTSEGSANAIIVGDS